MVNRRSEEQLLEEVRAYAWLTTNLGHTGRGVRAWLAIAHTGIVLRWAKIHNLMNYEGCTCTEQAVKIRRTIRSFKSDVPRQLLEEFSKAGVRATEGTRSVRVRGHGLYLSEAARYLAFWNMRSRRLRRNSSVIVMRLVPNNELVMDFRIFHRFPKANSGFTRISARLVAKAPCTRQRRRLSERYIKVTPPTNSKITIQGVNHFVTRIATLPGSREVGS